MILYLVALALVICLFLLLRQKNRARAEKRQGQLIRRGEMYGHLYPILERCGHRYIEYISISPVEVEIRLLALSPRTLRYTFEKQGFDNLTPQKTLALAQAVGVDIPQLMDRSRYAFDLKQTQLVNGETLVYYVYSMKIALKDSIMRSLLRQRTEVY